MCNAHGHSSACTCGFGGEGHLGRSSGWNGNGHRSAVSLYGDFCSPTRCYYCGASIFFVRHNGGSVWFDSLGQPWPKHECYYRQITTREDRDIQAGIDKWLRDLPSPLIGVVISTKFDKVNNAKYIVVKCSDDSQRLLRVYITFAVDGFVGEMVIFSQKSKQLIRPYLSLETIISLEPPRPQQILISRSKQELGNKRAGQLSQNILSVEQKENIRRSQQAKWDQVQKQRKEAKKRR